jgi:hypothetical protein
MGNDDKSKRIAIKTLQSLGITESKINEGFNEYEITYDNNNAGGKKIKKGTKVKVKARNPEEANKNAAKKLGVGDYWSMLKKQGRIKKVSESKHTVESVIQEEVGKLLGEVNSPELRRELAERLTTELEFNTINESVVLEATGFDAKALMKLIKDDKFLKHIFKTKYKSTPITQALVDIWKNYIQGDNDLEKQYKLA